MNNDVRLIHGIEFVKQVGIQVIINFPKQVDIIRNLEIQTKAGK